MHVCVLVCVGSKGGGCSIPVASRVRPACQSFEKAFNSRGLAEGNERILEELVKDTPWLIHERGVYSTT